MQSSDHRTDSPGTASPDESTFRWPQRFLLGAGLFAIGWAILRAVVQSLSIDEAVTYSVYVRPEPSVVWSAASNNHLLNSLLMRFTTRIFGLSELTMRMPALLGAAIYIGSWAYLLGNIRVRDRVGRIAQCALFVCLVFNPFVFDFFVAARGYGLALGFLSLAIASVSVWHFKGQRSNSWGPAAIASAACALSFSSNFSFAFACAFTWLGLLAWTWLCANESRIRLLAAFTIPGALLTWAIPLDIVLHWPPNELWFGSESFASMFASIEDALLTRLNPEFTSARVLRLFTKLQPFLLPVLLAGSALWTGTWFWNRRQQSSRSDDPSPVLQLAAVLGFAFVATLIAHGIAYYGFDLLLPRDRTALFLVPLGFGAFLLPLLSAPSVGATRVGTTESSQFRGLAWARRGLVGAQILLAVYFLLCMRVEYFKEWYWNADARDIFATIDCLHEREGIDTVSTSWFYVTVLNVYRMMDDGDTVAPFYEHFDDSPPAQLYVFNNIHDLETADRLGLATLTSTEFTDTMINAPAESAERLAASTCLQLYADGYRP